MRFYSKNVQNQLHPPLLPLSLHLTPHFANNRFIGLIWKFYELKQGQITYFLEKLPAKKIAVSPGGLKNWVNFGTHMWSRMCYSITTTGVKSRGIIIYAGYNVANYNILIDKKIREINEVASAGAARPK